MQRDFVKVDGADGPDVCAEARVGVIVAGQQPVWKHGAGGGGSEVSGLCVSVHWDVQQRGEGPGGVGPLLGPPGPGQTELLQLLQQVALLLNLLSIVELKASPVIWTKTPGKKFKDLFSEHIKRKTKGTKRLLTWDRSDEPPLGCSTGRRRAKKRSSDCNTEEREEKRA